MTQSNCNTCDHKLHAPNLSGHCSMFREEPDIRVCGYHSGLPLYEKGLFNISIWLAKMDENEDDFDRVKPSLNAVNSWLNRLIRTKEFAKR